MSNFVYKLCRLCINNKKDTLSLDTIDLDNVKIFEKLKNVVPETVEENDNLSVDICKSCHCQLNLAYVFKQNTIERYNRLKLLYMNKISFVAKSQLENKSEIIANENTGNVNLTYENNSEDNIIKLDENQIDIIIEQSEDTQISKDEDFEYENVEYLLDTSLDNTDDVKETTDEDICDTSIKTKKPIINIVYGSFSNRKIKGRRKKWGAVQNPKNPNEYTVFHPKDSSITITYIDDIESQSFYCKTCNKQLNSSDSLSKHIQFLHFGEQKYKCEFENCTFKTRSKGILQKHLSRHHSVEIDRPFRCNMCDKTYVYAYELRTHNLSHEKNVLCEVCAKPFSTLKSLNEHMVVHKNDQKHICAICGWTGFRAGSLTRHLKTQHDDQTEKKTKQHCPICQKLCASKDSLRFHVKRHNLDNWKYDCAQCNKKFFQKSEFIVHMRIHSGDRPYKCHCGRSFYAHCTYKDHLRTHGGEKQFHCEICGKNFTHKFSLKKHTLKIHQAD